MHVLHRPHLPSAAAIAAACALLAIVLALLLAGMLNDLASTSAESSPAATRTPVQWASPNAGWNLNPFTSLLRSPVRAPWTPGV